MRINLTKTSQIIFFILFLPVLSIFSVLILNYILQPFSKLWFYPFIDTFGIVGFYALFYSLFNSHLWNWSVFSFLGIVDFPFVGGRWKGHIISSFDNNKIPAILEIKQNFSQIDVYLYCKESYSYSLIAGFVKSSDNRMELHYEYHNEPYVNTKNTMHGHDGVVKLMYFKESSTLKGSYYNSSQHDRGYVGNLEFKFIDKNLQGKF